MRRFVDKRNADRKYSELASSSKSNKKQLKTHPVMTDNNYISRGCVFAAQLGYFNTRSFNFNFSRANTAAANPSLDL